MNTGLLGLARHCFRAAAALALFSLGAATPALAEQAAPVDGGARAMAMEIVAVVTDVDLETRQVSLQGPTGNIITLHASEQVVKLEDVSVGDELVVTYLAALEGEIREPTEEELAEPWVVLEEGIISEDATHPGAAGARAVRAVVTIEGLNRALGTVTVKDARGKLHLIADVEPEKIERASIGQTAVLVFTEALVLSLQKQSATAE
jgi:hypothetical protein